MDTTTLLVLTTAKSLYQNAQGNRANFTAGPVVTFEAIKPENAQFVHDACVKLGHKCSCAPGTHDKPVNFEKAKAETTRIDELLATSPLGQAALADRKVKEDNEAAKFAAQVVRPIDKYLEMTPLGREAIRARKEGK